MESRSGKSRAGRDSYSPENVWKEMRDERMSSGETVVFEAPTPITVQYGGMEISAMPGETVVGTQGVIIRGQEQ